MVLRWGIVSAGKISHDFVSAIIGALSQDEHQVIAVAARNLKSAQDFAQLHNIRIFYQGYENLAKDPNVDVVYIGALNPQHHEIALLMLENGKHVLCEKPFTLNEILTRQVIEMARKNNLFIMEAIWSRFFPIYQEIRELIDSGTLGDIRYASATFGVPINDVPRVTNKNLGGSATLDIGIYLLQFQQFVFQHLKPEKIVISGHVDPHSGTDDNCSIIFHYPNNKSAVISYNSTIELPNEAIIVGTKGTIKINAPFWAPVTFTVNGELRERPLLENQKSFNYQNSAGLAYEAIEVRKRILEGKLESSSVPHHESIQLASWMDSIRKELGVVFNLD